MSSKLEIYIKKYLIDEILLHLDNEELVAYNLEDAASLNGFMSCVYSIRLKTKTNKGMKERVLLAKFMRGDHSFRESSKSYIQYANEIYTYNTVLPVYEQLLKDLKINHINIKNLVAPCFIAKYGYIEGLSSSLNDQEACLVLENLKPLGYEMGPRLVLSKQQLLAMCKPLGQYHALSYGLKALNISQFEQLIGGIITFPFLYENDPDDNNKNANRILLRCGFDRFFEFYERKLKNNFFNKKCSKDLKLMENLTKLKAKHFENPARLQENLRIKILHNKQDQRFAVILHGDYNRNNVMFKFQETKPGNGVKEEKIVADVKLIDFQQLRYGSPALDLSFFMYFNSPSQERYAIWGDLLKTYHDSMFNTFSSILQASQKSEEDIKKLLLDYSFEKFQKHFARFAFYGVMICLYFLPWMLCSEEECARISELFASDIHGEEFRRLCLQAGGDEVNMLLLEVVRHASEMGYMEDL